MPEETRKIKKGKCQRRGRITHGGAEITAVLEHAM